MERLCAIPYHESISNVELYLRLWTGQADYEDIFQGLVQSELQAIALHNLSKGTRGAITVERAGKTVFNLALNSRLIALEKVVRGPKVPIDATDFDGVSLFSLSLETAYHTNAITRALLEAGADVNVPNKNVITALYYLAQDRIAK